MTEKWIKSTRGTIHYWISVKSNAPVLVFLHGLAADHRMFDAQIEFFQKAYTIVTWDAPGHGGSRPYSNYNMLQGATELKRILDAEHIDRCVLVGQAMGGLQAQVFIDHWPERVRGFVGIGTGPMEGSYYSKSDLARFGRVGKIAKLFPGRSLHVIIARRSCCMPYGREAMRRVLQQYSRNELCALIRRGYRGLVNGMEDAREINCPMILLMGEKDRLGHLRNYCQAWQERKRMPLYRIRRAGRFANIDNPRSTNRLILTFLNSLK